MAYAAAATAQPPATGTDPQRPQTSRAAAGGSLGGRVTAAQSGEPVAGALVRLYGPTQLAACTLDDGRFEFDDLRPGPYRVVVSRAGFLEQTYGAKRPGLHLPGRFIRVRSGAPVFDVDVTLSREGVVSGQVTDDAGAPVPDVAVYVGRVAFVRGSRRLAANTYRPAKSDDEGRYRVHGLTPGRYFVWAVPAASSLDVPVVGPRPEASLTTYYPDTTESAASTPLELGPGEHRSAIDIRLQRGRWAAVSGVLSGVNEVASGQATISVMRHTVGLDGASTHAISHSRTGADGSFRFDSIPPGSYVLLAYRSRDGHTLLARMPLIVEGADIEGLLLRAGSSRIHGRLVFDEPLPEQALEQFAVLMAPEIGDPVLPSPLVSPGGQFEAETLPGRYRLRVGPRDRRWWVRRITSGGDDVTDAGVVLVDGRTTEVVVEIGSRPSRLVGRVLDRLGQVSSPGMAFVFPVDPDLWLLPRSRYVVAVPAGPEGIFTVQGLPPGEYLVAAIEDPIELFAGGVNPELLAALRPRATAVRLVEGVTQQVEVRVQQSP